MILAENTITTTGFSLSTVEQFPEFYAVRPEHLENEEERALFQARYPELVEKYSDCWQTGDTDETA